MDDTDLAEQIRTAWGGLAASAAFRIDGLRPGAEAIEHRADEPLEVGSCFKAFVAAECCRQVERGLLRWEEPLTLTPDLRVPSSTAFGNLPDGTTVAACEAAEALIAVSDNTATDLLLRRLGTDAVRALVAAAGLTATRLPESVRAVYDAAEANPDGGTEACVSTMRDLTRFYDRALDGDLFAEPSSLGTFKAIMRQEDVDQGTAWAAGVTCYRKSGRLDPPPRLASAMAGAFEANGRHVPFAFACNVEHDDEVAAAGTVEAFRRGVSRGMRAIESALSA